MCELKTKMSGNALRTQLIREIRSENLKNKYSPTEYSRIDRIYDEAKARNLKIVQEENEKFLGVPRISQKIKKKKPQISKKGKSSYERWKKENPPVKCPQVSVTDLLFVIYQLRLQNEVKKTDLLEECLKKHDSNMTLFWDSASSVLKGLRQCLLTRSWDKMTHLLLILLHYDKKYLPVAKSVSFFLVKHVFYIFFFSIVRLWLSSIHW